MNIDKIINEMTLEEKVLLMEAKDNWSLNGVERLDIPSVTLSDGPNGLRAMKEDGTIAPTSAIPTESAISCSWNVELEEEIGRLVGEECRYYQINVLLGPGVNGKRSPLGGRNFEYFSEDPVLSGKMAAAFIAGLQSQGVGASLKHYVGNDQETKRATIDTKIEERTFREIYLKAFEIAIREGKPWTIMGAYPKFRGEYVCENEYLLKQILRNEFEYDGVVLSDWTATVHKVLSHKNGLDLETGSNGRSAELLDAVEKKEISVEEIDRHVRYILELIDKAAEMKSGNEIDWESHHELTRKAANESIVLLKNENHMLPLDSKSDIKIAVIGKFAVTPRYRGAGSSCLNPKKIDEPLSYICEYAKTEYAEGYEEETINSDLIDEACEKAKGKDAVIVFTGTTELIECEGIDRENMLLPANQIELVKRLYQQNQNLIVVNASGSAVELRQIEPYARAVIHMGLCGEGEGAAIADILFGKVNPSGKLSETFPVCLEQTSAYPFYPSNGSEVTYNEEFLVGYRYYDTKKIPVQYPFGHGLSYTEFKYSNMNISAEKMTNQDVLTVEVDVTNTGEMGGKEIVQLYISRKDSVLLRPEKELKAFSKVELNPGQTKKVTFCLDQSAFINYFPYLGRYAVESGEYDILVAASSKDIRCTETIEFESVDEVIPLLDYSNSMGEYLADKRYHAVTKAVLDTFKIAEMGELYKIFEGISLCALPAFMDYLHIPREQSERLMKAIYENKWEPGSFSNG